MRLKKERGKYLERKRDKRQDFWEHLGEFRKRLLWIFFYLIAGFVVAYSFHREIFHILSLPVLKSAPKQYKNIFAFHELSEPFFTYLKISFYSGIFIASPLILHQIWLFISPALYKNEKKMVVPFIFFTTILFISGGLFGYFIGLKYMISFFMTEAEGLVPVLTMKGYFSLAITVILGMGLVFELPILILFLTILGLIDHKFLISKLKWAIFLIFLIAAIITPSGDPVTQTIFALPMLMLYLLGIFLSFMAKKRMSKK